MYNLQNSIQFETIPTSNTKDDNFKHSDGKSTTYQRYLSWARDEPAETSLAPAKPSCAPYKFKKKYQLRKRLSKWNFAIFQFWKKILDGLFISLWAPGPCFNIKTVFPCMVSYVKDKTVPTVLSLSWGSLYLENSIFILRQTPCIDT